MRSKWTQNMIFIGLQRLPSHNILVHIRLKGLHQFDNRKYDARNPFKDAIFLSNSVWLFIDLNILPSESRKFHDRQRLKTITQTQAPEPEPRALTPLIFSSPLNDLSEVPKRQKKQRPLPILFFSTNNDSVDEPANKAKKRDLASVSTKSPSPTALQTLESAPRVKTAAKSQDVLVPVVSETKTQELIENFLVVEPQFGFVNKWTNTSCAAVGLLNLFTPPSNPSSDSTESTNPEQSLMKDHTTL